MTKNNVAWNRFIREKGVLESMYSPGFQYVSAQELNEITGREPRLLAKQDSLSDRPQGFKENNIGIFPVKNGHYILFRDKDSKSYYKFSDSDYSLPLETYQSKVDLLKYDSYPGSQYLSESQAIDFAYLSSLLRHFTNEQNLSLAIRGRLFSGKFDFLLPDVNHRVEVSSVQIEVDAGYESDNCIYLIEAKIGKRDDFHIRQLYYPYLEWSHKSKKKIVPIFFVYTNSRYYLYEFKFSEKFGDLEVIKKSSFSVNESPVVKINLPLLISQINIENEPDIPYPQADDIDKVIDLVVLLHDQTLTKNDISRYFEFDERQGDYYGNAGRYLRLLDRTDNGYGISEFGLGFLRTKSAQERNLIIVKELLRKPTFKKALMLVYERSMDLSQISLEEISQIIKQETNLTGSTPHRRASTVRNWLKWIIENTQLV